MEKSTNTRGFIGLISDKSHWIATILVISGFIVESIDIQGVLGGKGFHQLIVAPVLLLMGYSLFIFVVLKKLKI